MRTMSENLHCREERDCEDCGRKGTVILMDICEGPRTVDYEWRCEECGYSYPPQRDDFDRYD